MNTKIYEKGYHYHSNWEKVYFIDEMRMNVRILQNHLWDLFITDPYYRSRNKDIKTSILGVSDINGGYSI